MFVCSRNRTDNGISRSIVLFLLLAAVLFSEGRIFPARAAQPAFPDSEATAANTTAGTAESTVSGRHNKGRVKNGQMKSGWVKKGKNTYYYTKGRPVSGWKVIKGIYYYFDKKTKCLITNAIVGKGENCYYLDDSGRRVHDPVIRQAVSFVNTCAKTEKDQLDKLKACYQYIVHVCRYRDSSDLEDIRKMPAYAQDMFQTHTGNCYRGAAALAYAAKVLGYEVRMGIGGVTAYANHSLSTHGWTEIKIGTEWYICDTSMQRHHMDANLFLVAINEYPYRLRIDKRYQLTTKKGQVNWRIVG